jgi:hypothetical protein
MLKTEGISGNGSAKLDEILRRSAPQDTFVAGKIKEREHFDFPTRTNYIRNNCPPKRKEIRRSFAKKPADSLAEEVRYFGSSNRRRCN